MGAANWSFWVFGYPSSSPFNFLTAEPLIRLLVTFRARGFSRPTRPGPVTPKQHGSCSQQHPQVQLGLDQKTHTILQYHVPISFLTSDELNALIHTQLKKTGTWSKSQVTQLVTKIGSRPQKASDETSSHIDNHAAVHPKLVAFNMHRELSCPFSKFCERERNAWAVFAPTISMSERTLKYSPFF